MVDVEQRKEKLSGWVSEQLADRFKLDDVDDICEYLTGLTIDTYDDDGEEETIESVREYVESLDDVDADKVESFVTDLIAVVKNDVPAEEKDDSAQPEQLRKN